MTMAEKEECETYHYDQKCQKLSMHQCCLLLCKSPQEKPSGCEGQLYTVWKQTNLQVVAPRVQNVLHLVYVLL